MPANEELAADEPVALDDQLTLGHETACFDIALCHTRDGDHALELGFEFTFEHAHRPAESFRSAHGEPGLAHPTLAMTAARPDTHTDRKRTVDRQ